MTGLAPIFAQRLDLTRVAEIIARVLDTPTFVVAIGGVVLFAVGLRVRRLMWLANDAGAIHAGIVAVALSTTGAAPFTLVLAVGCLIAGGWIHERAKPASWFLLAAGAAFLSFTTGFPSRPLFQSAVLLFLPVAGSLVADFFERRPGLASAMTAVTVLGVYATVPDTNEALALLGGAAIFLPRMLPKRSCQGASGAWALVGLVVWVVVEGGFSRPGSVVGAIASLGLLQVEPLARAVSNRCHRWNLAGVSPTGNRLVLATHGLTVLLSARLAGFQVNSEPALVISAGAFVLGALLLLVPKASQLTPDSR